jgi:hypothetical protein
VAPLPVAAEVVLAAVPLPEEQADNRSEMLTAPAIARTDREEEVDLFTTRAPVCESNFRPITISTLSSRKVTYGSRSGTPAPWD